MPRVVMSVFGAATGAVARGVRYVTSAFDWRPEPAPVLAKPGEPFEARPGYVG